MQNFYKKGITAMELLVVVAVIGLLVSIVLPQFTKIRTNQTLKNASSDVLSVLQKARSQALASKDSSEYGVHFQSDKIIIFKGKVFSPSDEVNNEIINIITPTNISNVTLAGVSGTTGDLYFNRLDGSPSKTGTVTISVSSISKIITISATGTASMN